MKETCRHEESHPKGHDILELEIAQDDPQVTDPPVNCYSSAGGGRPSMRLLESHQKPLPAVPSPHSAP